MDFLGFIYNNVFMFLVIITLLVFVHELGHYLIARRCGVKVEVFSIGFGPEIYGWTGRQSGTRWRISALPLGGYVKFLGDANAASMPAQDPVRTAELRRYGFHGKTVGQRAAIVAGGPFANLLFAVVLLMGFYVAVGQPFTPPVIGVVEKGGPADLAGLQANDVVKTIDGRGVDSFEDVVQAMQIFPDTERRLGIERSGKIEHLTIQPRLREVVDRFGNTHRLGDFGIASVNALPRIGLVHSDSPAARAGLMVDDFVVAFNGEPVESFDDMRKLVQDRAGEASTITVVRDGRELTLPITPGAVEVRQPDGSVRQVGQIGIGNSSVTDHRRYDPLSAAWHASRQVVYMTDTIFRVIGQIILGVRPANEIGGPLRIAKTTGEVTQIGWEAVVIFMVGLSVTLGIFNLLPVPMLDGGHLLFYAFEWLRGRPLSERAQEYGFRIGLFLVLSLAVFATWNDLVLLRVTDLFGKIVN